jgi:citrate lyase subunit beta/citryl-CoA lyase
MHAAPAGLVVPKVDGPTDLTRLSHYLDALEEQHSLAPGSTSLLAVATETPSSLFSLGAYRGTTPRLFGLTWGAEDLAAGLSASNNRADDGTLGFTYQLARSLCLAGARAAGVTPVETAMMNFRDPDAVFHYASRGRQDGFFGMMAIHPNQVPAINRAFSPTSAEIAAAEAVIAAFACWTFRIYARPNTCCISPSIFPRRTAPHECARASHRRRSCNDADRAAAKPVR